MFEQWDSSKFVVGIEEGLRESFPHGHPDYVPITVEELRLHSDKNHDYAKGGDPLGNFKRVAAIMKLYPDLDPSDPRFTAMHYMLKQIDVVLHSMELGPEYRAKVEGLSGRLMDIAVYAKIVMCMERDRTAPPSTWDDWK